MMNSIITLTAIVVTVNLFKSCASVNPGTRLKACGGQLSNVLSEVCQGEYLEKRTKSTMELEEPDYFYNYENFLNYDIDSSYPFRAKRSLPMLRAITSKRESGVVDECCRKSCSIQELISYCKIPVPVPKHIKALQMY